MEMVYANFYTQMPSAWVGPPQILVGIWRESEVLDVLVRSMPTSTVSYSTTSRR